METKFQGPTDGQARVMWLAVTGLAVAVLVGLIAGLIWGLNQALRILAPVLWPLAIAGVLAYLLDPVVDWIERRGAPRRRAIFAVFALAIVLIIGLFGSVVPQAISETHELARSIPGYAARLQLKVERWIHNPPGWARRLMKLPESSPLAAGVTNSEKVGVQTNEVSVATAEAITNSIPQPRAPGEGSPAPGAGISPDTLQTASAFLAKSLPKIGSWLFGQVGRVASWLGVLAGLALIPVYSYYLLVEKRGIQSRWTDYLPVSDSSFKDELVFVIGAINGYLIAFFRGQVLVAICDGVLYTIGFVTINLPGAVLIGVLATFLTLIPYIGAIVTCVIALLLAVVQFGDWLHPVLVLVVFAVVQGLEGLVISPKIMGDRVGLHPLTIIIAVMAGTTLLGGILGGILAIPLTAVLRVLMSRYIWKRKLEDQA